MADSEWALALFRRSVLKQRKLAEITAMLGPTAGLRCLDLGSDNGIVSLLLRRGGGDWASADMTGESVASIRELGRFYSHRVRLTAGQSVVETGPYRYIRHPAYTGMLLAHVGFVVLFFHWLSLAALVLVFLPAVVLRVHIEEHALARSMAGYVEFCRGRRRLIPRIW